MVETAQSPGGLKGLQIGIRWQRVCIRPQRISVHINELKTGRGPPSLFCFISVRHGLQRSLASIAIFQVWPGVVDAVERRRSAPASRSPSKNHPSDLCPATRFLDRPSPGNLCLPCNPGNSAARRPMPVPRGVSRAGAQQAY